MTKAFHSLVSDSDDTCCVFLTNDGFERAYSSKEAFKEALSVLSLLQESPNLEKLIVPTQAGYCTAHQFTLSHKTLQFSNPAHWCTQQFLDAFKVQFTLDKLLRKFNYQLKDSLPENFSFDSGQCQLVDFSSIRHQSNVRNSAWVRELNLDLPFDRMVFNSMTLPFFLVPTFFILAGDTPAWRSSVTEYFCNSGNSGLNLKRSLRVMTVGKKGKLIFLFWYILTKLLSLTNSFRVFERIFQVIYLAGSNRVIKERSNYSEYYVEKMEDFQVFEETNWNNKQSMVKKALLKLKVTSVTDLGCNTGWFSILASHLGCAVKSIDVDNVSLNSIFINSSRRYLDIEVFCISFFEILKVAQGSFNQSKRPLRLESIKSDCLLALGLVHHLVLGDGHSFKEIFQVFSVLGSKSLVVEFIDISDDKIVSNPSFFKSLDVMRSQYNIEAFIKEGRKTYKNVEVLPSSPETRKLILFSEIP